MNKFIALVLVVFVSACALDNGVDGVNDTEICNGIDDNGDGRVDEGRDCDGDGFCAIPVAEATECRYDENDCNDANTGINPGATEFCNDNIDNDCDGQIDEGCTNSCQDPREGSSCQAGVGACTRVGQWLCAAGQTDASCTATSGTPGTEVCGNGIDDDCDGSIDEGCTTECTDPRIGSQCGEGVGICARNGVWTCTGNVVDCSATPGTPGTEVCNDGLDNDCDGSVDENCPVQCTDPRIGQSCNEGVGACLRNGQWACVNGVADCTATPGTPAASELCGNGIDDNCNGQIDEGCSTGTIWYQDADGDGHGCQVTFASCQTRVQVTQPSGFVSNTRDCNDGVYSLANTCTPICTPAPTTNNESGGLCYDGIDNDCDGLIDFNDPGCTPVCSPADGGNLRIELSNAVKASCPNSVIVVWWPDLVVNGVHYPQIHLSGLNATSFQEWANFGEDNFVRANLLCNVTNVQGLVNEVQEPLTTSNYAQWWTFGNVYSQWPTNGSDLSNFGVTMTFNGVQMGGDHVLSTSSGSLGEAFIGLCD